MGGSFLAVLTPSCISLLARSELLGSVCRGRCVERATGERRRILAWERRYTPADDARGLKFHVFSDTGVSYSLQVGCLSGWFENDARIGGLRHPVGCGVWVVGEGVGVPEARVAHEARNFDFFQTQA
jgi:hypothetical protein